MYIPTVMKATPNRPDLLLTAMGLEKSDIYTEDVIRSQITTGSEGDYESK